MDMRVATFTATGRISLFFCSRTMILVVSEVPPVHSPTHRNSDMLIAMSPIPTRKNARPATPPAKLCGLDDLLKTLGPFI